MGRIEASIVIPSYNESENLRMLLPGVNAAMAATGVKYDIFVIDTIQATDDTKEVCDKNRCFYINREGGNFYGAAVRTGIKYADGDYIIFMDADGSHSPEFLTELVKIRGISDVAVASRYVEGGDTDNNKILIFMSWVVNFLYSKVLNLDCRDVSNSFKLYRSDLLKGISLKSNNFDIIEEMLIKLKRDNPRLRIKEVPYHFRKRMFGRTKRNLLLFSFSYLVTLIKLKFVK